VEACVFLVMKNIARTNMHPLQYESCELRDDNKKDDDDDDNMGKKPIPVDL
jgi:hypothetical protein